MPTLIRLFIFLLVVAGIVFGSMVALATFVKPPEKEITIRIPARDLRPGATNADDPLGINALPDPVGIAPRESSSEPPAVATPSAEPSAPADGSITTVEPPPE